MPKIGLQRSSIGASVRQHEATSVSQHVRMHREGHLSLNTNPLDGFCPTRRGKRTASFADKHEGRLGLTFQDPQRTQFVAKQWMGAGRSPLGSAQMNVS